MYSPICFNSKLVIFFYLQYTRKVTKIKKEKIYHPDEFIQSLIHFITINIKFRGFFLCARLSLVYSVLRKRSYLDLTLFIRLMIITRLTN